MRWVVERELRRGFHVTQTCTNALVLNVVGRVACALQGTCPWTKSGQESYFCTLMCRFHPLLVCCVVYCSLTHPLSHSRLGQSTWSTVNVPMTELQTQTIIILLVRPPVHEGVFIGG